MTGPSLAIAITADPAGVRAALDQASQEVQKFTSGAQSQMAQTGAAIKNSLGGDAASKAALNFQQLRGGIASMAQAAVGQAVPGLASLAGVLGTFAIGSAATVGILAGITAIALAWRSVTKEAREAKAAHKELVSDLARSAKEMFTDPRVALRQEISSREAQMSALQEQVAERRKPQFREVADARSGVSRREQVPVEEQEKAIVKLSERFQEHAQIRAVAMKQLAEIDKTAAKGIATAAEEAARAFDARVQAVGEATKFTALLSRANEEASRLEDQLRAALDRKNLSLAEEVKLREQLLVVQKALRDALPPVGTIVGSPELRGGLMTIPGLDKMIPVPPSQTATKPSFMQQLGGARGIASAFLSPFASQGGALGTLAQGGLSFASGGTAGLAMFGLSAVGGLLGNLFGSSRDREEEIYRANLRAMKDAREASPVINFYFPRGQFIDTRNPAWQEAISSTLEELGDTRRGRIRFNYYGE
jgi:hypothetical protein